MKDIDKTKEELIKELEQFRLLVDSTSDFIWEVDQNGIYTGKDGVKVERVAV